MDAIPLLALMARARRAVALNFPDPVWVRAELAQVTERNGHRYLQLVQKGEGGEAPVAKADGVVWQRTFKQVLRKRGVAARDVLQAGQEVCVQVQLDLHEVYGLKVELVDWDPAFTLGQLELRRQGIVAALRSAGLLRANAARPFPLVPQRVAVLSSSAAAGYADFVAQLAGNAFGYRVELTLFDVAVQGAQLEPTVVAALGAVEQRAGEFDLVALLRGGGSRLDLADFDRAAVGEAIARCPLPVVAGIGHETDETLPDLVAHTSVKTPTALAELILARFQVFEAGQLELARAVIRWAANATRLATRQLERDASHLSVLTRQHLVQASAGLTLQERDLRQATRAVLAELTHGLDARRRELQALDPTSVFARGFSVATHRGRVVHSASELVPGDELVTHFRENASVSTVR